mmetsp:Transcript_12283/g.49272  ORF Transcript_12283/g.49272 Transcript_12283/m.49272 type:complete len:213 (+) Transcript_12283:6368-7006(+)
MTRLGSNSGLATYLATLRITFFLILSLSYVLSLFRNPGWERSLMEVAHQSLYIWPVSGCVFLTGSICMNMHTASMTSITGAGGVFISFTSKISPGVRVSSASTAAFSSGMAFLRSFSHSSWVALTLAASALASSSSFATDALTLSASTVSCAMTSIAACVSFWACTSCGWSAMSSSFIASTLCSVAASFSRPLMYRFFLVSISFCFFLSRSL